MKNAKKSINLKIMKKYLILILMFLSIKLSAQEIVEPSPIKWYDIETAMELSKKNPKPIFIDVYTDWCGWCVKMMKTTFASSAIAGYINTNFYPVRFDAETKDTIIYMGKTYVNTGKTHQLAVKLLNKRLSYPTIVFIDKSEKTYPIPGYLDIKDIEPLLIYFAEELTSKVNYKDFNIAYMYQHKKNYKDDLEKLTDAEKLDTTGVVNWLSFEEAIKLNKKEPRMFYVRTYVDWCYSCRTMNKITYSNPVIAKILNEQYYAIDFNAAYQKDIKIDDKVYKSTGKSNPHELASTLLNRQFIFPSNIFLNEKFEVVTITQGYTSSKQIEPILQYFYLKKYKTVKYQEYYKTFKGKIKN